MSRTRNHVCLVHYQKIEKIVNKTRQYYGITKKPRWRQIKRTIK